MKFQKFKPAGRILKAPGEEDTEQERNHTRKQAAGSSKI
jgi:hypothetical protein